jgi:hypothetical protein
MTSNNLPLPSWEKAGRARGGADIDRDRFDGHVLRGTDRRNEMKSILAPGLLAVLALSLAACADPYDPAQRAVGGGLIGAGTGAAIGAAAGGGPGAALGAAIGGAVGVATGVATTPPPPAAGYGYPGYAAAPGYYSPGYYAGPGYYGPQVYGYAAYPRYYYGYPRYYRYY